MKAKPTGYGFTVDTAPIAKARARVVTKGGVTRAYTPQKTATFEQLVGIRAREAMRGQPPLDGALYIMIQCYLPRPKAHYGKAGIKPQFVNAEPIGRPDLDNYCKAVLDGINGVVFKDDSQVISQTSHKFYVNGLDDPARVEVEVKTL